jgi:hypothetical protein
MRSIIRNIVLLQLTATLCVILGACPSVAQEWDGGFTVSIAFKELTGTEAGSADVALIMVLPAGTPLLSKENAVGNALAALKDVWNIESVHEDVLGFLGPQIPMDVQRIVSQVDGSSFVMAIIDAFDAVQNAGFSRFQSDTQVSATETFQVTGNRVSSPTYADAPRTFEWLIGGNPLVENMHHENWVIASLINYSAAVLSFRSELGRFPRSLTELRETGHLFIEPLNPYTGEQVKEVSDPNPGDITYNYISNDSVELMTYVRYGEEIEVVRREINLYASRSFDLLYRQTAGLSEQEKQVARYTFQISQILNEYYAQYHDLPYSVPQCETEGFAYVSFPNPFSGTDAHQAESLGRIQPGDYTYHRVSLTSYFLAAYGESGDPILSISKDLSTADVSTAPMAVQ